MSSNDTDQTTDPAPHPWRIDEPVNPTKGKGYFSIVDACGNRICDFFPFAGKGGRGWDATIEIARQIIRWERADGG